LYAPLVKRTNWLRRKTVRSALTLQQRRADEERATFKEQTEKAGQKA
jgi:hypothetical protein